MKDYSFGNYICELRQGCGLSQFQLGALIGVSDKAVSKWENGDAKPKLTTCFRLAEVLGVPINDLLSCKQPTTKLARKELNKMNKELWKEAYSRLSIFGKPIPALCWSRLAAEEAALHETDAIQGFAVMGKIVDAAKKNDAVVFASGSMASSFAAWLMGATDINPLPPHYRCPKCGNTVFSDEARDGFDLPRRSCACGEEYIRDGHNIPFEGFAKTEQSGTHVEMQTSMKFSRLAAEVIKDFYSGKAELIPVKLMSEGKDMECVDKYLVLPEHREKPVLSEDGFWHVDHGDYWHWLEGETDFTINISDKLNRIQSLSDASSKKTPQLYELIKPEVMQNLYRHRCDNFDFVKVIKSKYAGFESCNFGLLTRIEGFIHGSGIWRDTWYGTDGKSEFPDFNGELLVMEGKAKFEDIPAFREDLWMDISKALVQKGIYDNGLATKVFEECGKFGRYAHRGMPDNIAEMLLSIGMPKWYLDFMANVLHMFPKGHCIMLVLEDLTYEWYSAN